MAVFQINQEEINQYLARYEGNTPLVVFPRGLFTYKYQIHFVKSEIKIESGRYPIQNIDSHKQYKIVAGFNKTRLEEFIDHDWIDWSGKVPMLFNKRLVDKIQAICPNDFIALPVTIINLTNEVESYKNQDFCIINAIHTLDAIDHDRSTFYTYKASSRKKVEKRIYKDNPWNGHLIAFEKNTKDIIWHPSLAKELYPSKQFHFLTPEEDSFYSSAGYPEGHNKETFSYWINGIEKTMAYPRKSLFKFMGEDYARKKLDYK